MYEDSWYSFVPETSSAKDVQFDKPSGGGHKRRESLLQQPNGSKSGAAEPQGLAQLLEEAAELNAPPEATVIRRAKSSSELRRTTQSPQIRPARARRKRRRPSERTWEALALCGQEVDQDELDETLLLPGLDEGMLEASQQEYMLYRDQLALTERHLDSLITDADAVLRLLERLATSFRSVDEQTTIFRAQCDDLISEQKRLQDLADSVGTELHYYAYLDNATRRLNAPGAGRLVDDEAFGEILDNLDMCVAFMAKHPTYRDAESYQARFRSLLTKALSLLELGFTSRLDGVSADIAKQIAATQSESARHALAYGRFEQMMLDGYALIPNVQKVIQSAYDLVGAAKEGGLTSDIYVNTANNLFQSYLAARDKDLKPITQHDLDTLKSEAKSASVETAARNFVKTCLESSFNEANLFAKLFRIDPKWNINTDSAYVAMKSHQRAVMNGTNITPLATNLQAVLATAEIRTVCNVVGWITNEYVLAEYEEDESMFTMHCRELAERLLTEYLWRFTDALFEAEIAKTVTKAPITVEALKTAQATNGTASSGTYPLVRRSMELLVMFDECMPKERCQRNSPVVFKIVRECILALQRAEARIKALKNGTDPDLFMIKNLLLLKNELVSLEIGDIRSGQDGGLSSMQHFGHIWDTLTPGNLVGFISSFIPGMPWSSAAPPPAPPPVGSKPGGAASTGAAGGGGQKAAPAEDASEQLDDLLRQSIYAFTRRWGQMLYEARGGGSGSGSARKLGGKNLVKIERELDETLQAAFANQPEVVGKLKEAIHANVQAQGKTKAEKGRR